MMTDAFIKDVVIAAIRRHSMDMDSWRGTRLWDEGDPEIKTKLSQVCDIEVGERPILYSSVDAANWTLITTRQVWCSTDGAIDSVAVSDVNQRRYGDFKGYQRSVDQVKLVCRNGKTLYGPYETGKASMGTIYALSIVCKVTQEEQNWP